MPVGLLAFLETDKYASIVCVLLSFLDSISFSSVALHKGAFGSTCVQCTATDYKA